MSMWDDPRYSWTGDSWDTSWASWDGQPWSTQPGAPGTPTEPAPAPVPAPVPSGTGLPPATPVVGAPPPGGTTTTDPAQQNANSIIQQFLGQVGLGELADWAWQQIVNGSTPAQIELQLYDPTSVPGKVVDRLYPELQQRRAAGLPPLSIGDAVTYRNNAIQLMRAAGLPPTFYDQPDDLANLAGRDVSLAELKARIDEGVDAAVNAPADVRDQLHNLYGVDTGQLAAYYLDPERALPILHKQFAAAQASAAAGRTGFGALDQSEAERLTALGYSPQEVQQMTSGLYAQRELMGVLPGEIGQQIGRDAQLRAVSEGNVAAQEAIERRRAERKAQFAGGGSYGAGREGVAGLGSAAS